MKILVATAQTQGLRRNDFHYCVESELVRVDSICATDRADPDGGCGCGRAFAGMSSARATTTAKVVDSALTRVEYIEAIRHSLETQGYLADEVEAEADGLLDLAASWPVGAVIERRLWELSVRPITAEAAR